MPQHGQIITFSTIPTGSWCSVGVAYRVDRPKNRGSFRFERVGVGTATIDQAWAVARAVFAVVEG